MPNALQITDPNAGDTLAQAPSWADAAQSVAGTVSGGVSALDQWLAAQRAKNPRPSLWASGMFPTDTGYMGPGTARVEPEKMYDVQPILDLGKVNLDQPSTSPMSVQQQQWQQMYDALRRGGASQDVLDYHISQHPQVRIEDRWTQEGGQSSQDANVMMQAIRRRQQQPPQSPTSWRSPYTMQLGGDVVPLPLNDPSNFAQPEKMPNALVQPWDKYDWARQLFILPSNDPGRRQRPNTQG